MSSNKKFKIFIITFLLFKALVLLWKFWIILMSFNLIKNCIKVVFSNSQYIRPTFVSSYCKSYYRLSHNLTLFTLNNFKLNNAGIVNSIPLFLFLFVTGYSILFLELCIKFVNNLTINIKYDNNKSLFINVYQNSTIVFNTIYSTVYDKFGWIEMFN